MRRGFFGVVLALGGFLAGALPARAAEAERPGEPTWWFGVAGAANLNSYDGTTQVLNGSTTSPAPFHKGFGVGPYLAPRLEYRHDAWWGAFLDAGYDDRRGTFDAVTCPCGESASLRARPAYLSIEPNLRVAPFGGDFHVFAGPRLGFLWSPLVDERAFTYARDGFGATRGRFSALRGVVYSAQVGAGYDLRFPVGQGGLQAKLTPFVSYQPHFGQDPRDTDHDVEWWAVSTLRAGASLAFGTGERIAPRPAPAAMPPAPEARFVVEAPAAAVLRRTIQETFPLRNYVFFDGEDADDFSARYARLSAAQAASFREEDVQASRPAERTGRALRQMAVYHNLLNILGDRLRRYPNATLVLTGLAPRSAADVRGAARALARAEAVRRYLAGIFGIDVARLAVAVKPEPPMPLGRGPEDLSNLRAENRRVEVSTHSPELLVQVGEGFMLKPVVLDGDLGGDSVVFRAAAVGSDSLASWSVETLDDRGVARRFGPFTRAREAAAASGFLGDRPAARYAAVMTGVTRSGRAVRREAAFAIARRGDGMNETRRYAILFDIDEARAVSSYATFLAETVAPRVGDGATVFIRGRTDVVGDSAYNFRLSRGRAEGVERILESAVLPNGRNAGRRGVSFRPSWTGEDPAQAPFGNAFPEERCYNRTVAIDIVPE